MEYHCPMSESVVMVMSVLDLIEALDGSVDMDFGGSFAGLMERKYDDCGPRFVESIVQTGVEAPICVQVKNGDWIQGNGHHRLSVMFRHDPFGDIPVVFSETSDYMMDEITEGTQTSCWS